ncbi:MAG TPA: DedA family protein [Candidatus Paceibacterota bacterium]|nr:DedA family protein [Candidatus Paceibacterota bacterium]
MLEVILAQYGLIAVFIGTFFEGELVVIAAGVLASLQFLPLSAVLVVAFLATFLGDQLFFFLGRHKGTAFLEKRGRRHWRRRAEKVHDLIHNHQNKILFGYRFLYGLRIPTLFALGTSELPTKKFVLLNLANSILWTALFVLGGYFFGDVFISYFDKAKFYSQEIVIGAIVFALIIWVGSWLKNREEYN